MARAGAGVAVLVAALILGPLGAVLVRAGGGSGLGAADWAAIRFTMLQAALSAALSVALAVPVARALARRRFLGRGLLVTLLGAPFILPSIVAIIGLLAVFGRSGLLNRLLEALGLPGLTIYGLHGVVLAHVFFNMPLAIRLLLQGWLAIPAERFRLAAALGMGPREIGRWLERPMLREVLPGAAMVIFLICLTSFAVALTLGGGPRATTVELAIYQAFRFDFDLGRAAMLAIVQLALTGLAAAAALGVARMPGFGGGLDPGVERWDARGRGARILDTMSIGAAALFLLLPLALVAAGGLAGATALTASVARAATVSLGLALASVALVVALALPLALAVQARPGRAGRILEAIGHAGIAASPLVIGTGLFLLVFPIADPQRLALPVTALVNALMSLPFALRVLIPAVAGIEAAHGRLATALGMAGWARLRWLLLPRLRRPLGFAAGLTAALSMGDLGVIALFADGDTATLPLQVYRLMAGYRMAEAASAALLLLLLSLALFWAFDRGGRTDAAA